MFLLIGTVSQVSDMAHGPLVCKCVYALHVLSLFIEHNFHNRQDKRVDLRKKIIKYVFTYRNLQYLLYKSLLQPQGSMLNKEDLKYTFDFILILYYAEVRYII